MSYATKQDLIERFGADELAQLTDRAGAATIDDAVLARAFTEADALIDGYVCGRYATPLSPVPVLVAGLAADIARYKLWKDAPSDAVRKGFDEAKATLKAISDGTINLPGVAPLSGSSGSPVYEADDRRFGDDSLCGFA